MPSRRHSSQRASAQSAHGGRKANQLCSQIERTLNYVLSGECDDDVLRDLVVDSVVPAPDDKHVLVTLSPLPASEGVDAALVLSHLARARDLLRREVAFAITRKRVPELSFRFNPSLTYPPLPATLLQRDDATDADDDTSDLMDGREEDDDATQDFEESSDPSSEQR